MRFVVFFFLCLCVNYACNSSHSVPENAIVISVDLDNRQKTFDLTNMLDTTFYDIIPLETDSTCLIGEISDLFFDGEHFYVVDKMNGSIFGFDRQGKFLFKINKLGRGAGEYTELTGAYFTGNQFYVYDVNLEKLLVFGINGDFIDEYIVSGIWAYDIFVFHNRVYYLNDWSSASCGCYRLYSTNLQGGDLQKMLPFPKKESTRGWGCSKYYSLTDERVSFIYSSLNMLYCLDSTNMMQEYYLDFGKYNMPEAYALKSAQELLRLKALDKYTLGLDKIWETKNYFFGNISEPYSWLIFNKNSKQIIVADYLDISSFVGLSPWFCQEGYLICCHPTFSLIGTCNELCKEEDISVNFKSMLKKKVENLNDIDNPVLFLYKLKDEEC